MALVRCPSCGRVADGNVCFACGHEWSDQPAVASTPPATAERSPSQDFKIGAPASYPTATPVYGNPAAAAPPVPADMPAEVGQIEEIDLDVDVDGDVDDDDEIEIESPPPAFGATPPPAFPTPSGSFGSGAPAFPSPSGAWDKAAADPPPAFPSPSSSWKPAAGEEPAFPAPSQSFASPGWPPPEAPAAPTPPPRRMSPVAAPAPAPGVLGDTPASLTGLFDGLQPGSNFGEATVVAQVPPEVKEVAGFAGPPPPRDEARLSVGEDAWDFTLEPGSTVEPSAAAEPSPFEGTPHTGPEVSVGDVRVASSRGFDIDFDASPEADPAGAVPPPNAAGESAGFAEIDGLDFEMPAMPADDGLDLDTESLVDDVDIQADDPLEVLSGLEQDPVDEASFADLGGDDLPVEDEPMHLDDDVDSDAASDAASAASPVQSAADSMEMDFGGLDALDAIEGLGADEAVADVPVAAPPVVAPPVVAPPVAAPVDTGDGLGTDRGVDLGPAAAEIPKGPTLSGRVGTLAEALEEDGRIAEAALLYEVQAVLSSAGR